MEVGIEYKFHLKYIQALTHTHTDAYTDTDTHASVLLAFVVCVLGYFEIFVLICCGNDANNAANFEPELNLKPQLKLPEAFWVIYDNSNNNNNNNSSNSVCRQLPSLLSTDNRMFYIMPGK